MAYSLQPFLHDLVPILAAPTQAWSCRDGQIQHDGAQGVLHADVRVLSVAEVGLDAVVEHVATDVRPGECVFTSLVRGLEAQRPYSADPSVRLDRTRVVRPGEVTEVLELASVLPVPVELRVTVRFAADFANVELVKSGGRGDLRSPETVDGQLRWSDAGVTASLAAPGAALEIRQDDAYAVWALTVPPRGTVRAEWSLTATDTAGAVVAAGRATDLDRLVEQSLELAGPGRTDRRLEPWLRRSLADLTGLRMAVAEAPDEVFFAAGAPWYFTLFGRDSLISARMMLPLDRSPAEGTLRALARLQGRQTDPATAEEPGKIPHELRRVAPGSAQWLPPLYYGTVDATCLWVALLHDTWRAGASPSLVPDLLPHLRRALDWIVACAEVGGGFLTYRTDEPGLVNQGWKDSADAVRFADGTIATGPIALCEVQGYAYEAAVVGADLLDAFGEEGAEPYRRWAAALAERFRASFWCGDGDHRWPALALDGERRRVDALSSDIGHLLGTGLLDPAEERRVAELVSGAALDSGLGLRTMAATDGGYAPLSYHCGSVWPHDTAVVIAGLVRAGLAPYASGLVEGLLRASVAFDQRLPELWSGEGRPVPYPASCRPQAWSAAAVVPVVTALGRQA